jgi:selenocysteine-specific elongation factor
MELVHEEVLELLADTPWPEAPRLEVSSVTGEGVEELRDALFGAAGRVSPGDPDDVVALPVDRAFTVKGTGTVITGTLVSGTLTDGARVRLLPPGLEGRVRGLQRHGEEVRAAGPGGRTAVALAGEEMDLEHVHRGQLLTTDPGWLPSSILTVHLAVLEGTGWRLEHNQRVRVHLGTAEVMARVVIPDGHELPPGGAGWAQLRAETPVAARSGQPVVLRSYSPLTTIAGGRVVEVGAPKRGRLDAQTRVRLESLRTGNAEARIAAVLELAGWAGVDGARLPMAAGVTPAQVSDRADRAAHAEAVVVLPGGRWIAGSLATRGASLLEEGVDAALREEPWRRHVPVENVRAYLPAHAADGLADALLDRLVTTGRLHIEAGRCRTPGHAPRLTPEQEGLMRRIAATYREAALAPPTLDELPADLRQARLFEPFLARLQDEGTLVRLDERLWIDAAALSAAVSRVRSELSGESGLGPADFREVLPLTRKHLLPILIHMDSAGVTRREGDGRTVAG